MDWFSSFSSNTNYLVASTIAYCIFLQYLKFSGIRNLSFVKLRLYFCFSGIFWLLICLFFAQNLLGMIWYWQVLWGLSFFGSLLYLFMSGQLAAAVLENAESKVKLKAQS